MTKSKSRGAYPHGFTIVPNWVLELDCISGSAKSLLIALLRHDYDEGKAVFPSQERLGLLVGSQRLKRGTYRASPEAIAEATKELERVGLVSIEMDRARGTRQAIGKSLRYRICHDVLKSERLPEDAASTGTAMPFQTPENDTNIPTDAVLTKQSKKTRSDSDLAQDSPFADEIASILDNSEFALSFTQDMPDEAVPPPWAFAPPDDRELVLYEITETIIMKGGPPENPRVFERLCDVYGDDRVWRQTRALPVRIDRSTIAVNSPAALLHESIVNDYAMPEWPPPRSTAEPDRLAGDPEFVIPF